jgi:hypothetical protein
LSLLPLPITQQALLLCAKLLCAKLLGSLQLHQQLLLQVLGTPRWPL